MNMDTSYQLNPMQAEKTFDVSAFAGAFDFAYNPIRKPYAENYNFSQFLFALEGEGVYMTENESYRILPGTVFYRPAGRTSQYYMIGDQVHLLLIDFVCASPAMERFEGAPIPLVEEERSILLDLIRTGVRVSEPVQPNAALRGTRFKEGTPPVVLDFIRSSLERFLCMLYCRLQGISLLIDETQKVSVILENASLSARVQQYLMEHISEKVTLKELCAHFGMSESGLTRKFRRETQTGLMEYFLTLKITLAKVRIEKSPQSFAEISDSLGFSSPNYFSKVFKAKVGMTPTEYSKFASKRRAMV